MAEGRTVRMASESPVALIGFIVATVVLLVVCYFLYAAMASRQVTLMEVENGLSREVLSAMKGRIEPKLDNSPAAPTPYGSDFFALLGKTTRWGLNYKDLADAVGFPPESAVNDLKNNIKEVAGTSSLSAKDVIKSQKEKNENLQKQLDGAAEAEKKLHQQIEEEKGRSAKAIEEKTGENQKLTQQVGEKEKDLDALRGEMKTKLDAVQEEMTKVRKEVSDQKAALEEEKKAFIAKLDKQIQELRTVLQSKGIKAFEKIEIPTDDTGKRVSIIGEMIALVLKPAAVTVETKVQEGKILSIKPKIATAYVNLGAIDGLKTGMMYTVFEIGKGGKRVEKGEVEVTKVEETTSAVAIVKTVHLNPIVAGDIVVKKAPEAVAKAPIKAAPKVMPPPPKAKPKEEEEGAKAEEGKKEEKAEEGKKEAGKEAPMKEEGGEKKAAEEKKGEGKEEGKEEKKESKEGKAPSEKAMMQKLSEAANAINAARESKDWDTTKAKADEVAELAKMAAGMEGQQEDKAGWYNALAEGASELSAAAGEKKLPDAMAAMKKVGETCKPCHEKYKK